MRLAGLIDAAPVDTRGLVHCPAARPAPTATVRFVWPGGVLTVREGADACGSIVVQGDRGRPLRPLFDPSRRLLGAAGARRIN